LLLPLLLLDLLRVFDNTRTRDLGAGAFGGLGRGGGRRRVGRKGSQDLLMGGSCRRFDDGEGFLALWWKEERVGV